MFKCTIIKIILPNTQQTSVRVRVREKERERFETRDSLPKPDLFC